MSPRSGSCLFLVYWCFRKLLLHTRRTSGILLLSAWLINIYLLLISERREISAGQSGSTSETLMSYLGFFSSQSWLPLMSGNTRGLSLGSSKMILIVLPHWFFKAWTLVLNYNSCGARTLLILECAQVGLVTSELLMSNWGGKGSAYTLGHTAVYLSWHLRP